MKLTTSCPLCSVRPKLHASFFFIIALFLSLHFLHLHLCSFCLLTVCYCYYTSGMNKNNNYYYYDVTMPFLSMPICFRPTQVLVYRISEYLNTEPYITTALPEQSTL